MADIRRAAVAGMFYPDDEINLKRLINQFFSNVPEDNQNYFIKNGIENIFGMIVPHAGYIYSGQTAAYAYSLIDKKAIDTVFLIGPSHYAHFDGFALSSAKGFRTPLGVVNVDTKINDTLKKESKNFFDYYDSAHEREHSLEVQIPFLQSTLENNFSIVPILMGDQSESNAEKASDILSNFLKNYDKKYLIVCSTDLSHFHNKTKAEILDKIFIEAVSEFDIERLSMKLRMGETEACGAGPVLTFLKTAKKLKKSEVKILHSTDSSYVSGDTYRVVGYFSAVIW